MSGEGARAMRAPSRLRGQFASSMLRAVMANSAWLIVDRLLRMALALLVGAWVARHLGPSRYGELAYGVALVALWQAMANLGLDSVLVRDLSREPEQAHRLLGTALGLRLASGSICWVGAVACSAVLQPGNVQAIAIAGILGAGLLFQTSDIVDLWFQGRMRSRLAVLPRSLAYVLAATLKVALILIDAPLWAFAGALLTEGVLVAVNLSVAYRQGCPTQARWAFDRSRAIEMLRESWPFMVAGLSVIIYMRIDQIVLSTFSNPRELGLYSAVMPFSQAWHLIPMTICASVLPGLSVLKTTRPDAYTLRIRQLFTAMFWSGLLVAASTALAAPWIIGWLLGPAFGDAVNVLRWHAATNVFVFLGTAQSVAIVGDGTSRIALARTVVGASVSLSMNLLLVSRWGAIGAAWSAVVAYFFAAVVSTPGWRPTTCGSRSKPSGPFMRARVRRAVLGSVRSALRESLGRFVYFCGPLLRAGRRGHRPPTPPRRYARRHLRRRWGPPSLPVLQHAAVP